MQSPLMSHLKKFKPWLVNLQSQSLEKLQNVAQKLRDSPLLLDKKIELDHMLTGLMIVLAFAAPFVGHWLITKMALWKLLVLALAITAYLAGPKPSNEKLALVAGTTFPTLMAARGSCVSSNFMLAAAMAGCLYCFACDKWRKVTVAACAHGLLYVCLTSRVTGGVLLMFGSTCLNELYSRDGFLVQSFSSLAYSYIMIFHVLPRSLLILIYTGAMVAYFAILPSKTN